MSTHEIDDGLWQIIEPFLPPRNRLSDAPVQMNGDCSMGSCMSTGCTWYDVPRQYGTKSTVHRFHLHLCHHDIYDQICAVMQQQGYDLDDLDLSCCAIDSTTIPAKRGSARLYKDCPNR